MKPISTISVASELPEALAPLRDLAMNLRWTWRRQTVDLFRSIDEEAWQASGENPIAMLPLVPADRLAELAADKRFHQRMRAEVGDLDTYLTSDRWFQRAHPDSDASVAYFSMEFGITPTLPIYSGGLGILAGDHLKSASDLGVPLIGIGLLYQWGYFSQSLNAEGWQQENYQLNDPSQLATEPVTGPDGAQLTVHVQLPGSRDVTIALWKAQVGRIPLLLLDTNVEDNDEDARAITDRLYGGDHEHRIVQEIVLGIGGVRAVHAFAAATGQAEPQVFHMNEGHAGFSGLERIGELMQAGAGFDEALGEVRAGTVFTTHTPVPAGIDRFDVDELRRYLDADSAGISRLVRDLPVEAALALGQEDDGKVFNMAHMGFRLAQRANGVSKLHGEVSREMFQDLYPGFDVAEVPIGSVTNGVHRRTWVSAPMDDLYKKAMGDIDISATGDWSALATLTDHDLIDTRTRLRTDLVHMAREHMHDAWLRRGADEAELAWTQDILDPEVLTIGFARRVSTYKRLTLMLSDRDRLRRILTDPERPVQFVIAGKAHPADIPGKQFMQELVRFADEAGVRHRIAFLPDYDIKMASVLVAGSDVWLNNPVRPEEASGTSGMKAVMNGGLTFSISDGWWDEMATDDAGWTIPTVQTADRERRDRLEADALYEILEHRIAPLFYDRDEAGVSHGWLAKVRASLVEIAPQVTASRMVRDYVNELYLPAAGAYRAFSEDPTLRTSFTDWKASVSDAWPRLRISDVRLEGGSAVDDTAATGAELTLSAQIDLAGLDPRDVVVEAAIGAVDDAGELTDVTLIPMKSQRSDSQASGSQGSASQGSARYAARFTRRVPGVLGYTVRVVPQHEVLGSRAELGLVATA